MNGQLLGMGGASSHAEKAKCWKASAQEGLFEMRDVPESENEAGAKRQLAHQNQSGKDSLSRARRGERPKKASSSSPAGSAAERQAIPGSPALKAAWPIG